MVFPYVWALTAVFKIRHCSPVHSCFVELQLWQVKCALIPLVCTNSPRLQSLCLKGWICLQNQLNVHVPKIKGATQRDCFGYHSPQAQVLCTSVCLQILYRSFSIVHESAPILLSSPYAFLHCQLPVWLYLPYGSVSIYTQCTSFALQNAE